MALWFALGFGAGVVVLVVLACIFGETSQEQQENAKAERGRLERQHEAEVARNVALQENLDIARQRFVDAEQKLAVISKIALGQ